MDHVSPHKPQDANSKERLKCDFCEETYSSQYAKERHMRRHTGERSYVCPVDGCGAAYARADYLLQHRRSHARAAQDVSDNTFPGPSLSEQSRPVPGSPRGHGFHGRYTIDELTCHVCGKVLSQPSVKKRHLATLHANVEPLVGSVPGSSSFLAVRESLTRHENHVHDIYLSPEKRNRAFDTEHFDEDRRWEHDIRAASRGSVPEFIEVSSDDGDVDIEGVEAHADADGTWDLRQCTICLRRFPYTSRLEHHRVAWHNPAYPYVCDVPGCGKHLSRKDNLLAHKKGHELGKFINGNDNHHTKGTFEAQADGTEQCPICLRKFSTIWHLESHKAAWHNPQYPYVCDVAGCGKRLSRMDHWNTHKRLHEVPGKFVNGEYDRYLASQVHPSEMGDSPLEDHAFGSFENDFEAQLLAAANSDQNANSTAQQYEEDEDGDFKAYLKAAPTPRQGSHQTHYAWEQPYSSPRPPACEVPGSDPSGFAVFRLNNGTASPAPELTKNAPQAGSNQVLGTTESLAAARPCYCCGKVFSSRESFFGHAPCFARPGRANNAVPYSQYSHNGFAATNIKSGVSSPLRSTLVPGGNQHAQPTTSPYFSSAKVHESHQRGSQSTQPFTSPHLPNAEEKAALMSMNIPPSGEVQRLLLDIAQRQPETRPIPPEELQRIVAQHTGIPGKAPQVNDGFEVRPQVNGNRKIHPKQMSQVTNGDKVVSVSNGKRKAKRPRIKANASMVTADRIRLRDITDEGSERVIVDEYG